MTTLYREVPITAAEQAEALPVGTVAMSAQPGGGVWRKRTPDSWVKASMTPSLWTNEGMANRDAALVALVPVEVESQHEDEEFGVLSDRYSPPDVIPAIGWSGETAARRYRRTVIHTPWEEA